MIIIIVKNREKDEEKEVENRKRRKKKKKKCLLFTISYSELQLLRIGIEEIVEEYFVEGLKETTRRKIPLKLAITQTKKKLTHNFKSTNKY